VLHSSTSSDRTHELLTKLLTLIQNSRKPANKTKTFKPNTFGISQARTNSIFSVDEFPPTQHETDTAQATPSPCSVGSLLSAGCKKSITGYFCLSIQDRVAVKSETDLVFLVICRSPTKATTLSVRHHQGRRQCSVSQPLRSGWCNNVQHRLQVKTQNSDIKIRLSHWKE